MLHPLKFLWQNFAQIETAYLWYTEKKTCQRKPSGFVHHFRALNQFQLELQSRNTQLGSNLTIFYPLSTWNMTNDLEKQ